MASVFQYFTHDDTYGPGTDLAMVLLGIFILNSAIVRKNENDDLKIIKQNQKQVVVEVAEIYNIQPDPIMDNNDTSIILYKIPISFNNTIEIENSKVRQRFKLGGSVLFPSGSAELSKNGETLIGTIGGIIKNHLNAIEDIQIEGHADTIPPNDSSIYKSNIELASARATSVFNYLKNFSSIDPALNLMSITSFGEFRPVIRETGTIKFNRKILNEANDSEEERAKNRRIEIVLIYK